MQDRKPRIRSVVSVLLIAVLCLLTTAALAQSAKIKGIIQARSGDKVILQAEGVQSVITVILTDNTDVGQLEGMLKARNKKMSMAALIPGLPIQVEGVYNSDQQLVANTIRFKGNDFQQAKAIQAGMHEQGQVNQAQQAELASQKQSIASNKAEIDANTARFGQLDDYYIYDEITIYFANGKSAIDAKYNTQLADLAKKAESVNGYMIEVKGYASKTGSAALNQQLSQDRATNVVNFLQQQGNVPLTRMLAPGAMGETGDSKSGSDQAEARRVVVRVLQNKAIAGTS